MTLLEKIVASKIEEVAQRKRTNPLSALDDTAATTPRDFAAALSRPGLSVIAELKRKSPSKGSIRRDLDPPAVARSYELCGAAAISVLTDAEFFGGFLEDLTVAGNAVSIPVLRKEFIVDPYQIHESRHAGADAVLLIVRILEAGKLAEFLGLCDELNLAALTEVHNRLELDTAVESGARIIGINNRNLDTLEVDTEVAHRLRSAVPSDRIVVAESGIRDSGEIERLRQADFDAILVGESLLSSEDPGAKLCELIGENR